MTHVCVRLRETSDGVPLRSRARPQSLVLREDVPHPVRTLPAAPDLRQGLLVIILLSLNETTQPVGIRRACHSRSVQPNRIALSWKRVTTIRQARAARQPRLKSPAFGRSNALSGAASYP